jgi:osmotically-inducible protein OsmY
MADRYDDRYRGEEWRRDRGFGREFNRDERGPVERGSDEVRSWFGDEEAERRRRMDESRYGRDWDRYGRDVDRNWDYRVASRDWDDRDRATGSYGRDWDYGHKLGLDYGRHPRGGGQERLGSAYSAQPPYDYGRTSASRDWNEPAYYRSSYTALGPHTQRATSPAPRDYNDTGTYSHSQNWFSGRGPRGYQRSDERIREDVCDRLCDDPFVDATDIDVSVKSGEVTLTGNVRERADKRRVEDVIENVSGVREVHNNLHVGIGREQGTTAGSPTAATTSRR